MTENADRAAAELRRRLEEVFGDVLPDVTRDERDDRDGRDDRAGAEDEALLRDRPPHHDRE